MIRTHLYTSHSGNPSAMSWVCLSFLVAWHTAGAAMPAEAGFESVELQSHTTPHSPAASSQGCHQDAAVISSHRHIVTSSHRRGVYYPSLPPPSSRPRSYPPTPALSQLTPSTPSSGNCCVPAISSHTVTVTQSHASTLASPAPTRPAGSLQCLLPLGHRALIHFCCLSSPIGLQPHIH